MRWSGRGQRFNIPASDTAWVRWRCRQRSLGTRIRLLAHRTPSNRTPVARAEARAKSHDAHSRVYATGWDAEVNKGKLIEEEEQ